MTLPDDLPTYVEALAGPSLESLVDPFWIIDFKTAKCELCGLPAKCFVSWRDFARFFCPTCYRIRRRILDREHAAQSEK